MKIIYQARDITEAHIVSGMLNANGIETYVGGYYLQGGVGELATMNFANVQVADKDIHLGKSIVAEYESKQAHSTVRAVGNKCFLSSRGIVAILLSVFFVLVIMLVLPD